jgi:hypothetical protein
VFLIFAGETPAFRFVSITMATAIAFPIASTLSVVWIASQRLTRPAVMFASKLFCAEDRLGDPIAARS